MKLGTRDAVGRGCLRWRGEVSEMDASSVDLDSRSPSVTPLTDTTETGGTTSSGSPGVLLVLCDGDFSQVGQSVVIADAVDVIEVRGRPRTVCVQPRQAVSQIRLVLDGDLPITLVIDAASDPAESVGPVPPPGKSTCVGVVMQDPTNVFCREFHGYEGIGGQ